MNEEQIIQHMIEFVEETEERLHQNTLAPESKKKSEAIKLVLKELERVTSNENQ